MTRKNKQKSPTKADKPAPAEKKKRVGPMTYFRQVYLEGKKVTWTSRNETIVSTIMVLIMCVIAAVFFWALDWTINTGIQFLLGLGA